MAGKIYVTYTPTTAPGSYHTAIHYERTDPAGNVIQHFVIEAKPEKLDQLSASDKAIGVIEEAFRNDDGPSRFGRISATVSKSKASDDLNAPYETIAEGEDLSENFARMQLYAHGFNRAGFAYRGGHQNSNTLAGAALRAREFLSATGVKQIMATTKRFSMGGGNAAVPKRRPDPTGYLTAVGALFLCLAQVPSARADPASCIANVSSYVAELDELLSKERNWITPYEDLNERYFPFRDCEAGALLKEVSRSHFIQPIGYHPGLKEYFISFSSDEVRVGFTYLASEKKSRFGSALWVHK